MRATTLYEKTPSIDDDEPTSLADDANPEGDTDTSFEIDEPDDEEADVHVEQTPLNAAIVIHRLSSSRSGATTPTNDSDDDAQTPTHRKAREDSTTAESSAAAVAATSAYTVPSVLIGNAAADDDPGAQTDLSESNDDEDDSSHTASSTPTTADVADIRPAGAAGAAALSIVSPYTHKLKRLPASQQARLVAQAPVHVGGGLGGASSIAEDENLSASIATTTTDVEFDGIAAASPMTTQRLLSGQEEPANDRDLLSARSSGERQNAMPPQNHKRTQSSSSYWSVRSNGSMPPAQSLPPAPPLPPQHSGFYHWVHRMCHLFKSSGIGEPSVYHAVIVIFLEFFAWGLLAMPLITVLNQTFPDHTFLMNGMVMGIKGILSFLSAPLVGALSDIWGRKFFLLITVFFTCAPIPLMTINSWWFFAMVSLSGVFAVTFSVVFAYVADVTTVEERSRAYGLVSATFAASLVISPALGALLREKYSDTLVVALATAIAVLDVFFILVAVPESLPEKMRPVSWGTPISWEQADPFSALRKVGTDRTILMQCVTVLLSYLPEAGQYSCIFVYLKLKMGFNSMEVAIFIAVVGILSISIQVILGYLMRVLGGKRTIILGLILETIQMLWYGFGSQAWMMWAAGVLAAIASITYPAISAFVSLHSTPDSQGVVQGIITGMRGLCNGLGPAMFGVIFYFFNVDLNGRDGEPIEDPSVEPKPAPLVPGPPFAVGAIMVVLAIIVAVFIPDSHGETILSRTPSEKKRSSKDVQYTLAQL